jgi:hypothetical protein
MTSITDPTPRGESLQNCERGGTERPCKRCGDTNGNTINAGTRLIEEGALLPESVRFESEPWTVLLHGG